MHRATYHTAVRSHAQRARTDWRDGLILLLLATLLQMQAWAQTFDGPLDVLKKMSIQELMNIQVTSVSKRPEKLATVASSIQVITQDDIRRAGTTSLPEALRLASNLQVAQKNSHDWGISARGFNTELANKMLVLIDGRTVYTPLYSGVLWDAQDYLLEDIERIEVISGPGGTLWGANAVNGVINIITRNAGDTHGLYAEGGGGTELRNFAGLRYGGELAPDVDFRVYGKSFNRDDASFANGNAAGDAWHQAQAGFRLDAQPSTQNQLTLQGDIYHADENQFIGDDIVLSGHNMLGRWLHTYSERADSSLQMYYDRTHLSIPKPASAFAGAGVLTDNLDTYDVDFQHRFAWNARNRLVWGLGYRFMHDAVGNAPTIAFLPTRLDHNLYSGFVENKVTLSDNLFLTLGTKLEHNSYTGLEFEPSGRLQWNYAPQQMLWSAVSRAVRTPSRIDRDLSEPTNLPAPLPASILDGSAKFRSETLIAYELGHRAHYGSQLATTISTFYNDYDHVRSVTPTAPFVLPLVFDNNVQGHAYGLEFSLTYQPIENWQLRGGYNFLKESLRVKPGTLDFTNALNEVSDPEQQWSLRSSLNLPKNFQWDVGLRWVATLHNNQGSTEGTVPSYYEADMRLGWQIHKQLELSLIGQNLLHAHHPEFGFPGAARVEIPRSLIGKAAWHF